jgi:hypothetical protein
VTFRGFSHDPGSGLAEVLAGVYLSEVLGELALKLGLIVLSSPNSTDTEEHGGIRTHRAFSLYGNLSHNSTTCNSGFFMLEVSHRPIQDASPVDFKLHHYRFVRSLGRLCP